MTINDIIDSMNVIQYFNPNMASLYDSLVEEAITVENDTAIVTEAFEGGEPVYESLIPVNVKMANALHDYVYNVIRPFDSIMVKNSVREQVCRQVYGIEAHF